MFETYNNSKNFKNVIEKSNYICDYISDNHIEYIEYKRTIFDMAYMFEELDVNELQRIIKYFKYIYNNKELVLKLYEDCKLCDDFFNTFLESLDKLFNLEKEKYRKSSLELDKIKCYSDNYISYLKQIMVEDFIDLDMLFILPSNTLVAEDEKQASILSYLYGTYQLPLSYKLTYKRALGEDISDTKLIYQTPEDDIKATFTIEEFMENPKRTIKK